MKPRFRLEATTDTAELFIYETIGEDWWGGGVTAAKVADELKGLSATVKTINVRVNSPGGDVFDGIAIYNQLAQYAGTVNVFIDGLAASAASVIAMAGDNIQIAENAMLMIHNPWSVVIGEAADMRKSADTMDKIKETLVLTYQRRSGQMASDIARWMDEETWLTGQEAVDKGFADSVMAAKSVTDSVGLGRFAAHYKKAPAALVNPPAAAAAPAATATKIVQADFSEVDYLRRRLNLLAEQA